MNELIILIKTPKAMHSQVLYTIEDHILALYDANDDGSVTGFAGSTVMACAHLKTSTGTSFGACMITCVVAAETAGVLEALVVETPALDVASTTNSKPSRHRTDTD